MLTRWTLENFKPIRARLDLKVAPLTVLAGLNSSGKSSLLQSILLVSQTLANQKLDEPLVLNGPLVRLGTFLDVCNDRASGQQIGVGFALDGLPYGNTPIVMDLRFKPSTEEETTAPLHASRVALVSTTVACGSYGFELHRASVTERREYISNTPWSSAPEMLRGQDYMMRKTTVDDKQAEATYLVGSAHFMPLAIPAQSESEAATAREVILNVNALGSAIRYLGPLRADPYVIMASPSYSPSGLPDDVGPRGEYAAAVYASNRQQPIRFWNPLSQAVETAPLEHAMDAWLRHLGIADHVSTRAGPGVSWMVRTSATQTREHPLPAVGVGVSQVLPILVAGLLAPEGTILIMEQPELHLHERPQARLGDFFYGLTRVGKQVFVETHSAVLVNQLRYLMVTRGQEARDAIAVYFVEQDEQGDARFEPIKVSKGGAVENWPDGFFDESFRQEDRITQEGICARGKRANA